MPELTDLADLTGRPQAEVFETGRPKTVRIALDADQGIPPHSHPGSDVVVHLLAGRLEVTVDGTAYDLHPGHLLRFSGDREVALDAAEESIAIVVLAPAAED